MFYGAQVLGVIDYSRSHIEESFYLKLSRLITGIETQFQLLAQNLIVNEVLDSFLIEYYMTDLVEEIDAVSSPPFYDPYATHNIYSIVFSHLFSYAL